MAISCPVDLDTRRLRDEIRSIYARVAVEPAGDFHFHRGPDYAAEFLHYDRALLAQLPDESTASFAGVANPHRMGPLGEGTTVVDIGCGAGMDLMLAARSVGRRGRAIGVDMTEAMADKARASARAAGLDNIEVRLSSSRTSSRREFARTSISGRVELPALSRRESSWQCSARSAFAASRSASGSIRSAARARNASPASMAS